MITKNMCVGYALGIVAGNMMLALLIGSAGAVPSEEWNRTFGGAGNESANSVVLTSDGNYIFAGYTSSYGAGNNDVWLAKTDANGNELWNRTFGGEGIDYAFSVQNTSDGGYIIAGGTTSYGAGDRDVWLVKTNASGTELWNKTFGGNGLESANSVQQTSDGGYIIGGISSGGLNFHGYLIKTSANGNLICSRVYTGTISQILSVKQTSEGGYIFVGNKEVFSTVPHYDAWLVKTDASGNEIWNRTFGEAGPDQFGGTYTDAATCVQQIQDGYILAGYTRSYGAGLDDAWLIKTNASGNEIWNKTFGGSNFDQALSVDETSDGGYIVGGLTNSYGPGDSNAWLIKTEASGNEIWNKTFGKSGTYDMVYSVLQTSGGEYLLGGTTESYGAGGYDAWLIKVFTSPEFKVYVPWTATTQGWTTPFVIANNGNSSASINIKYYDQADGSHVGSYPLNILPGASKFVFREWTTVNTDGSAVLVSDQPISVMVDQFNNGENKFAAYEVEPSGANWIFLPWTATTQGWTTPYVIVNRGTENSVQGMTYFNIAGSFVGTYTNGILPGASKFVFREWSTGGDGGVYMNSSQQVSVLVDMFKNSENKFGAYTPASTLSDQVFIPWTATTQGWSTPFKIFNGGVDSAIVTIVYFNQADGLIAGTWNVSIAPREVVTVYRENSTANGTDGSAVLNSITEQPISVIVEQLNNDEGKFEVYTPAMTASNNIVIPWTATTQGWTTPYVIVNRGNAIAGVNITYYNQADGSSVGTYSTTILPGASKFVFREWTTSASTTDGSAVVASDQPITVMVDQFNNGQNKFGAYTPIE